MNRILLLAGFLIASLMLFFYCSKDKPAPQIPVLTTAEVSAVTRTTAECGGTIILHGGATVTVRGVCWSTGHIPTMADSRTADSTGKGSFTSSITGLTAGTTYYAMAYATNNIGTGYGNVVSFTTLLSPNTVIDIDGNIYKTVTIGTQVWMAENLKVTRYRNGDALPNITVASAWVGLTTGAYCNYNNDVSNVAVYGRLYNWYAIDDSRTIAPIGWHVPTDAEWQALVDHIGGSAVAGGKMKEIGTTHWQGPNTGATNKSGFSALPGSVRVSLGSFQNIGSVGCWWSATEGNLVSANGCILCSDSGVLYRGDYDKVCGFSVRCIKD